MADTIRTLTDLVTNLFKDGQPSLAITPQDMRDLLFSVQMQYAMMTYAPGSLTLTLNTWDKIDLVTTLQTANGFSNSADGDLNYDAPPINSITGANDTKPVIVMGFCSFEPATAGDVFEFTIGKDNTASTLYSHIKKSAATATDDNSITFMGIDTAVASGQDLQLFVKNVTATRNITINALHMFALALTV